MFRKNSVSRIWRFYKEGFQQMTWGRTMWCLILIKLFIMFAILKLFFFPDFLREQTGQGESKPHYVGRELVERAPQND